MKPSPAALFFALFPFACGYFLSFLLRSVNAVVAPDLTLEFGLGPAQLGFLTAAFFMSFALFQLPLGVLLDRYGARRVQTCLLMLAAAGCLVFAYAQGLAELIVGRAIIGLGFSAGLMSSFKSSSVWVPYERRALANSAIMSAGALGLVVATEPTSYFVMLIGWRNVFLALAAIIALTAGFIFLAVPEKAGRPEAPSFGQQIGEMVAILRTPLFWRVAPMLGLSAGIGIAYQSLWAGPWFLDVMQLSRAEAARHLLWMGMAFLGGILLTGILADRLQRIGIDVMKTYLAFMVPHTLAQALLVINIADLSFLAWLMLSAASQSAILAFPWFAARIGEDMAGRANAVINFSMFVVAFATQYGVGLILSLWPRTVEGGYAPAGYSAAFAVFLALQIAAILWYLASAKGASVP